VGVGVGGRGGGWGQRRYLIAVCDGTTGGRVQLTVRNVDYSAPELVVHPHYSFLLVNSSPPLPVCCLCPCAASPPPAQAFVIKPVSIYLGEGAAVKSSAGLLSLTFLAMGAATHLWQLLLCLVPLAAGSVMISTLNTARLSKVSAG
jgi:hypothetical protein